MRSAFHFAVVILGLCLSLVCSSGAYAFPVTWTLSGVTFNDGGTATGSFVYDADTNSVSTWSISTAGGNTAAIPPFTYDPADPPGSFAIVQGGSPNFLTATYDPVSHFTIRSVQWDLGSSLSDAGGTVAITADGNSYECIDCSPFRLITAGSLIGTAAPAITSAASATFTLGTAGTFTVTSTGAPVSALSESGALPSGVSFADNGDGTATLSGTPAAGTSGTYAFTITANNGVVPDATQNFTLTVNQAPAITSAASTTFTVGSAGSFTVSSTGAPTAALSETGTLPSGITFVDNGNGTATLSGTPTTGTGGTYVLTITASNGVVPDATQAFTLVVQAPAVVTSTPGLTMFGMLILGLLLMLAVFATGRGAPHRE